MSQMTWDEVAARFAAARNWWVSTTGIAGPHAVPLWGVVLDDALVFYGSPETVRTRNLAVDARLVLHLEDGEAPLLVHGRADPRGLARAWPEMVEAYRQKYRQQHDADYLLDREDTADSLAFVVTPTRAMAWQVVAADDWIVRRWRASASLTRR